MGRDGENGIKGQYRFVNGVWNTRRSHFDENTPLYREVSSIVGTSVVGSRQSISSSSSTLNGRVSSSDARGGSEEGLEDGSRAKGWRDEGPSEPNNAQSFIHRNLDSVKGLVERVMGRIIDRGERIEQLRQRADTLSGVSDMFRRRGNQAHTEAWLDSHKVKALCGVVVTWSIAVAVILSFLAVIMLMNKLIFPAPLPAPAPQPPPGSQNPYPYPYPPYPQYPPPQYPAYPPPYPYPPPPNCYCPPPGQAPYPGAPAPGPAPIPAPQPTPRKMGDGFGMEMFEKAFPLGLRLTGLGMTGMAVKVDDKTKDGMTESTTMTTTATTMTT
ncbi:hypothetical protein BC829DRAFT_403741 [Chytridium lagenaria]|nr:hypothetical protein BC829DRAFT_403741 [Chytridium lagenaria]